MHPNAISKENNFQVDDIHRSKIYFSHEVKVRLL